MFSPGKESFHGVDISMIAKNFPSGSSALCPLEHQKWRGLKSVATLTLTCYSHRQSQNGVK